MWKEDQAWSKVYQPGLSIIKIPKVGCRRREKAILPLEKTRSKSLQVPGTVPFYPYRPIPKLSHAWNANHRMVPFLNGHSVILLGESGANPNNLARKSEEDGLISLFTSIKHLSEEGGENF